MTSASTRSKRVLGLAAGTAVFALALAGCAPSTGGSTNAAGGGIIIGTTDKVTFLDPAGSFDNGSQTVQTQIFGLLMTSHPRPSSRARPTSRSRSSRASSSQTAMTSPRPT
jgi:peptide/nickel transport system substrate-binding protein